MTEAELHAQLLAAGEKLKQADTARAEALAQISDLMKAAGSEANISELARLAGVSRVTAYRLLEK